MAKRSNKQNDFFHARLGDWSQGIRTAYKERYSKDSLKMLVKAVGEFSGDAAFSNLVGGKTSQLDSASMDKLINLMEEFFSRRWPDAYVPARGDEKWG